MVSAQKAHHNLLIGLPDYMAPPAPKPDRSLSKLTAPKCLHNSMSPAAANPGRPAVALYNQLSMEQSVTRQLPINERAAVKPPASQLAVQKGLTGKLSQSKGAAHIAAAPLGYVLGDKASVQMVFRESASGQASVNLTAKTSVLMNMVPRTQAAINASGAHRTTFQPASAQQPRFHAASVTSSGSTLSLLPPQTQGTLRQAGASLTSSASPVSQLPLHSATAIWSRSVHAQHKLPPHTHMLPAQGAPQVSHPLNPSPRHQLLVPTSATAIHRLPPSWPSTQPQQSRQHRSLPQSPCIQTSSGQMLPRQVAVTQVATSQGATLFPFSPQPPKPHTVRPLLLTPHPSGHHSPKLPSPSSNPSNLRAPLPQAPNPPPPNAQAPYPLQAEPQASSCRPLASQPSQLHPHGTYAPTKQASKHQAASQKPSSSPLLFRHPVQTQTSTGEPLSSQTPSLPLQHPYLTHAAWPQSSSAGYTSDQAMLLLRSGHEAGSSSGLPSPDEHSLLQAVLTQSSGSKVVPTQVEASQLPAQHPASAGKGLGQALAGMPAAQAAPQSTAAQALSHDLLAVFQRQSEPQLPSAPMPCNWCPPVPTQVALNPAAAQNLAANPPASASTLQQDPSPTAGQQHWQAAQQLASSSMMHASRCQSASSTAASAFAAPLTGQDAHWQSRWQQDQACKHQGAFSTQTPCLDAEVTDMPVATLSMANASVDTAVPAPVACLLLGNTSQPQPSFSPSVTRPWRTTSALLAHEASQEANACCDRADDVGRLTMY